MSGVILLHTSFSDSFVEQLNRSYEVVGPVPQIAVDLPADIRSRVDVLMTHGMMRTDEALMRCLPNLRLICCYGSGTEGVDHRTAAARNIAVANGLGANAPSVAELAVACSMALCRGIVRADRFVRAGSWRQADSRGIPQGKDFSDYKIGIYGLGAIGSLVARSVDRLGNEVGYHGRTQHAGVGYQYFESLRDLALWAEVLVLSARAVEENRHVVDASILDALGPQGFLVNIARGSLINESLLEDYLENGKLGGAALDVYDVEPCYPERLSRLPNVILTPHIGSHTEQSHARMNEFAIKNIRAALNP